MIQALQSWRFKEFIQLCLNLLFKGFFGHFQLLLKNPSPKISKVDMASSSSLALGRQNCFP